MGVFTGPARAVRHTMRAAAEASLIAAIVGVVGLAAAPAIVGDPWFASDADAAPKVKATLAASATAVAVGDVLLLQGGGLDPDRAAWVRTETASAVGWWNVEVRTDGTYTVRVTFPTIGTAKVALYQVVNNRTVLMSSCTVTVQ